MATRTILKNNLLSFIENHTLDQKIAISFFYMLVLVYRIFIIISIRLLAFLVAIILTFIYFYDSNL